MAVNYPTRQLSWVIIIKYLARLTKTPQRVKSYGIKRYSVNIMGSYVYIALYLRIIYVR